MMVSMASTYSLEDIASAYQEKASVEKGGLWFQLYIQPDREFTYELAARAERANYSAIVVTVDSPRFGQRERDIRNCFHDLPNGYYCKNVYPANIEFDSRLTWKDIENLKLHSKLPLVIKGILDAEDARAALNHGADAIFISNHGGRQFDGTVLAADVLPEIINAVRQDCPVLVDGGIRRGVDVVKVLALGADAIALGRPIVWGLAIAGEQGVCDVLSMIRNELEQAMYFVGCPSVNEISSELLRR